MIEFLFFIAVLMVRIATGSYLLTIAAVCVLFGVHLMFLQLAKNQQNIALFLKNQQKPSTDTLTTQRS